MASSDVDAWSDDVLLQYLEDHHISDDDIQSVDEVRMLVKTHIESQSDVFDGQDETERTEQGTQEQGTQEQGSQEQATQAGRMMMAEIIAKDEVKRRDLIKLYTDIQEFDSEFAYSVSMKDQYPGRLQQLDGYIRDLQEKECPIVVAGEVGSGKSSFLNLLIGQEIFTSSQLPWTSAICFLRSSDHRTMEVIFDDQQTATHNLPNIQTLKKLMRQYSGHSRITGDERRCQRINIHWPVPILPENVVLVDVPGVGERPDLDQMVLEYISKAVVCIYIVFSSNAGGVQKDKLKLILNHRIQSFCKEGAMHPFEHTLFVCNHWDEVEASGEEETVWNNTLRELKSCVIDLNEDNVVKISVKEAVRHLKNRFGQTDVVRNYQNMLRRFDGLLQASFSAKTSYHYSIIATMLLVTGQYLACRRHFAALQTEDRRNKLARLQTELRSIREESKKVRNDIEAYMQQEFTSIALRLHEFLHSKEIKERLLNCKGEVGTTSAEGLNVQENIPKQRALDKLERIIQEWEETEKMIAGVQNEAQQRVQTFVARIFKRMQVINLTIENASEDALLNLGKRPQQQIEEDPQLSIEGKIFLGITAPIWVPLGLAVGIVGLVIGVPAALVTHAFKRVLVGGRYFDNKFQRKMYHHMEYMLEKCLTLDNLENYIRQRFFLVLCQQVDSLINEHVLKTNRAKGRQLSIAEEDRGSVSQIIFSVRDAKLRLEQITGRFRIYELLFMSEDYIGDDDMETSSYIGGGAFSNVYKGTLTRLGRPKDIAIKVFKRQIQPETVFDQLLELKTFRALKHPNIVEYIGVHVYPGGVDRGEREVDVDPSAAHQPSWMKVFGKTLAICLELCNGSLKENAFRSYRIQTRLANGDRQDVLAYYVRILQGVCSGLVYIHDLDYMHRDLKLSNVLIRDGIPKIADFGVSRACDLAHNTLVGTLTHMSPEMLANKAYSKPTDIYSMAILMWEFWYGKRSFTEARSIQDFIAAAIAGQRPRLSEGVQMPKNLQDLVTTCWHGEPNRRPTAIALLERLKAGFNF